MDMKRETFEAVTSVVAATIMMGVVLQQRVKDNADPTPEEREAVVETCEAIVSDLCKLLKDWGFTMDEVEGEIRRLTARLDEGVLDPIQ